MKIVKDIIKAIFRLIYFIIYYSLYFVLKLFNFDFKNRGILTAWKAKKIRLFLKVKIFLYHHMKWFIKLIGKYDMYSLIYEKMNWYGL